MTKVFKTVSPIIDSGSAHIANYPQQVQFCTKSFTEIDKGGTDLYCHITNTVIYLGFSVINGDILMLKRSELNNWPTRLFISNTVKIGKNANFRGFDEIIQFKEYDFINLIYQDDYFDITTKKNILTCVNDIINTYKVPVSEPLTSNDLIKYEMYI